MAGKARDSFFPDVSTTAEQGAPYALASIWYGLYAPAGTPEAVVRQISQDVTAIAVGIGPGPFTGLRVGLVTARTMAMALDIPVYGVCTLDILAAEAIDGGLDDFLVATDARRKEVYLASYADGARVTGPDVVRPADAATEALVVGRGAVLYPEAFPRAAGPEHPRASTLCDVVVNERFPLLDPDPLYLRRPDTMEPGRPKRVT